MRLGKNKMLNLRSIGDLIFLLIEKSLIEDVQNIPQKLSFCFKLLNNKETFTFANLPSENKYSEHRLTLEKKINSLILM